MIAFAVLFALQRVVRSPFGHVLVAIRENEQRATFQGYDTDKYKLLAFVLSTTVTGLAGALLIFLHRLAAAESTTVAFSGELLAMVVIGGMRSFLGPALGALFYLLFRELFSIYTDNWLLWFGLIFVGFVIFSPTGPGRHLGQAQAPLAPAARGERGDEPAQDLRGPAAAGLPAARRRSQARCSRSTGVDKHFGGIRAVSGASLTRRSRPGARADRPQRRRQDDDLQPRSRACSTPDRGTVRLHGQAIHHLPPDRICQQGLARSFQITNLFKGLTIYENLRLSLQARHAARFNFWRDIDSYAEIHAETAELMKFLGLEGIEDTLGGDLSYGGQRLVDLGIALGSKPQVLLMDEPLAGLAAGERERVSQAGDDHRQQHPGADRRARHRPRAGLLAARHGDEPGRGADERHARRGAQRRRACRRSTPAPARRRSPAAWPARRASGRRCCASTASTPSTARATSSTTRRWTCAKARSWRCSAATAPASRRCSRRLCGLLPPAAGTIEFEGRDIAGPVGARHRAPAASAMCRRGAACSPA